MPGSTSTRRAIRRYLYDEIPQLGFAGTADSVTSTTIVDTYALQDTALGTNHFRGTAIYRPDTTGDNIVKKAGNLTASSGTLAHTGTNYSDTSDAVYEIVGFLHPDDLNACIQRALRKIYFETQTPLTLVANGDFESGTTNWSDINSDETASAITAAANVFSGTGSLRVQNATANGGQKSASIPVHPGEHVWVSATVRVDTGTADLVLYDETNSAELASVTTTNEHWTRLHWSVKLESTTENITVRITGQESNFDGYWDNVVFYRSSMRMVDAPSWLNEPFKFLKLRQAGYLYNIDSNSDDATSRTFSDWFQPNHFSLDPFHPEANAYRVILNRPVPNEELWIEGKRPFYDIETLANDNTATTTAPFLQVVAYSKLELATLLKKRYPTDPQWEALEKESQDEIKVQTLSRPEIPDLPRKTFGLGRI